MTLSEVIQLVDTDFRKIYEIFPQMIGRFDALENNICHNRESVYSHAAQVYSNIISIENEFNLDKFGVKINLLKLAIIFHDSGKGVVIQEDESGKTRCPGHEQAGQDIFDQNARNIEGLSSKDIDWVRYFIMNHTEIDYVCDKGVDGFDEAFEQLKECFPEIYRELLIFGYCDLFGSYLEVSNPLEYKKRIGLLTGKISDVLSA